MRRALMEFHVVDSSQMFNQSKGHGTKAGEPLRAAVHTVRIRVGPTIAPLLSVGDRSPVP
ncbi:hypothetical protein SAMN05444745_1523 [Arthrobacter sp. OV608]|nr:hypothetical protein SAMN05444745_1523 [Arthrobacter sp. OV608]